jgi:hypothetical protein
VGHLQGAIFGATFAVVFGWIVPNFQRNKHIYL